MIYDLGKTSNNNHCYAHDLQSPFATAVYEAMTASDNPVIAHTFGGISGRRDVRYHLDGHASFDDAVNWRDSIPKGLPYGWHTLTWEAWIELHDWMPSTGDDFDPWPKEAHTLASGQVIDVAAL